MFLYLCINLVSRFIGDVAKVKFKIMYSTKNYILTKKEYGYLLPAIGRDKVVYFGDRNNYALIVSVEDLEDVLNRLSGLYDYFEPLDSMLSYKCFKSGSLEPFRAYLESL